MIKLLIKHTITEHCINVLFENIYNNFYPQPKLSLRIGSSIKRLSGGDMDLLVYKQYALPLIRKQFPMLLISTPMGSNEFINEYFNK